MGEAKRKAARAAELARLGPGEAFRQLGIDSTSPGFYDDPAFQARERLDPAFLESYARFVRDRELSPAEFDRAKRLAPAIAQGLHAWMDELGRQRACMDAALALSKMLEEVGVWSAVIRGALSVELDGQPQTRRYFHAFGPLDAGAAVHGHTWIFAPPFAVIDVAAKLQPWQVPGLEEQIPSVVLSENPGGVEPNPELLFDHDWLIEAQMAGRPLTLRNLKPQVVTFMRDFPGTRVAAAGVTLTYQPTATSAPDCPLEQFGTGNGGTPVFPTWRDRIRPSIEHLL